MFEGTAVDETAEILARLSSLDKQRDYAYMEANGARRRAYELAYAEVHAGGSRGVFDAANAAAHGVWAERCAVIKAEYAACTGPA